MDPHGPAVLQARRWRSEDRAADAAAMARLAKRPTATWFADAAEIATRVREASGKAANARRSSLLVAYRARPRLRQLFGGRSGSPSAYLGTRVRARDRRAPRHRDPGARRDRPGGRGERLSDAAKASATRCSPTR